jgi:hypothetical protein
MPFDAKPSSWITSWTEDATSVSFDMADLLQALTSAEADATTGDWRDCLYSLLDHSYQYFDSLPVADRPTQLTLTRVTQKNSDTVLKLTYTVEILVAIAATDVSAE